MSFMEAQITVKSRWIEVDGPCGIEYIPVDIPNVPHGWKHSKAIPEWLRDYCENKTGECRMISGYGVRSSAPGYMDCTPWTVYDTEEEAEEAYALEEEENNQEEVES